MKMYVIIVQLDTLPARCLSSSEKFWGLRHCGSRTHDFSNSAAVLYQLSYEEADSSSQLRELSPRKRFNIVMAVFGNMLLFWDRPPPPLPTKPYTAFNRPKNIGNVFMGKNSLPSIFLFSDRSHKTSKYGTDISHASSFLTSSGITNHYGFSLGICRKKKDCNQVPYSWFTLLIYVRLLPGSKR